MKFVIRNPYFEIEGNDFSSYVKSVEVDMKKADVDFTASGDQGQTRKPGLNDDSFKVNLFQDHDASGLDDELYGLYQAGQEFQVRVAQNGGTPSVNNPFYVGTCLLLEYVPISGDVGSAAMTAPVFVVNGQIVRDLT